MFKPFGKDDRILHERPFLDSEVPFHVVHRIADDPDSLLLHSEDRRIIIAESDPEKPMWIWVDRGDMDGLVNQVILGMEDFFKSREHLKLVSMPEFFDAFLKSYPCSYQREMVMEAYECREVTLLPESGIITLPSLADTDLIADFCAGFLADALGVASSRESQQEGAQALIRSGNLYVLKVADEIVAMSNIAHRSARHARINNVYTPPSHRKKGYASLLVADLSRRILSEGLIPVLYTDLTNETSNKIYQEIGYKPCGKVDQYGIEKVQQD
ncbi:MAG TPA: GNAT family N-acetyltransferase [Clostridiaceae bacterium]|nr:GNAT family N-acetyltransferase [Clostridiaceae bacterium]